VRLAAVLRRLRDRPFCGAAAPGLAASPGRPRPGPRSGRARWSRSRRMAPCGSAGGGEGSRVLAAFRAAPPLRLGRVAGAALAPAPLALGLATAAAVGVGVGPAATGCRGRRSRAVQDRQAAPRVHSHRAGRCPGRPSGPFRRPPLPSPNPCPASDADGAAGAAARPSPARLSPSRSRAESQPPLRAAIAAAGAGDCVTAATPARPASAARPQPRGSRPTGRDRAARPRGLRKDAARGVSSNGTMRPAKPSTTGRAVERRSRRYGARQPAGASRPQARGQTSTRGRAHRFHDPAAGQQSRGTRCAFTTPTSLMRRRAGTSGAAS
jgi:hypothetical protein